MKATKKELFYDQISDKWGQKINDLETNKRLSIVFTRLLRGVSLKNKKFLEVGCGLGYFSAEAAKRQAKVTGIDVGKNLVSITKKKVKKGRFIVANAAQLPFKDNAFEVVLSTEVIEHVDKQQKMIQELHRVTKKGGFAVLTTPNLIFKPLFSFLSFIKVRPYHGNEKWYFPRNLKKDLTNTGFEIVRECNFNFVYPTPLLNYFERYKILSIFMINQGYLLKKK